MDAKLDIGMQIIIKVILKRLSTIEPCKIENLCWKVLLIFYLICEYFGNIPHMISYLCDKIL